MCMGLIDFHDTHAGTEEVPGQIGAIAPRGLNANHGDLAESAQPGQELPRASASRGERLITEPPSSVVQGGCMMHLGVAVHATNHDHFDACGHAVLLEGPTGPEVHGHNSQGAPTGACSY